MITNVGRYHWAFMVGPKRGIEGDSGVLYDAKERPNREGGSEWYFEERACSLRPTAMLLVRVVIGKIEDEAKLATTLRSVPVRQSVPGWNCVSWIIEALQKLEANSKALGTSVTGWSSVRNGVMSYVRRKTDEHRFDGQASYDMGKAATFDLIEGKELVP